MIGDSHHRLCTRGVKLRCSLRSPLCTQVKLRVDGGIKQIHLAAPLQAVTYAASSSGVPWGKASRR